MQEADVGALLHTAMLLVVKLGGPPLLAALAVGLLVSLLQSVTQINESTLAFVPKLLAIGATLLLLGGFMQASLGDFMHLLFDRLIAVGGT